MVGLRRKQFVNNRLMALIIYRNMFLWLGVWLGDFLCKTKAIKDPLIAEF